MNRYEKRIQEALGSIEAALKDSAADAARSAQYIMGRFETANMIERVDAQMLGMHDFRFREYINSAMGQKLGRFIAEKINFVSRTVPDTEMTRYLRPQGTVEFRAEVYVLTPQQFKDALDAAYKAGR